MLSESILLQIPLQYDPKGFIWTFNVIVSKRQQYYKIANIYEILPYIII